MDSYQSFTWIGIVLILLGVILVAIPLLSRFIPNLEKLPWIIVWVYRRNGFIFATSPILILVSVVSLIISYFFRSRLP